jgi:hypothetical protein
MIDEGINYQLQTIFLALGLSLLKFAESYPGRGPICWKKITSTSG